MTALSEFLTFPFVWRAIAAGVLIALCASLLGVTLVLRRLSFMGDGLSHVAFGALAISGVLGLAGASMAVTLPLTAICAVVLLRGRAQGDSSLAMLSVGAMAVGYLLMNIFPASSNVSGDVCTTLFGAVSLLTLSPTEAWLCAGLSIGVVIFHLLTYHRNFDIAFDEDFARASGVRTGFFNLASAIVSAVVIVVSMRLVGALLVSALLVFPAVCAMRVCKSFCAVTVFSAIFAVVSALWGILLAIVAGTPVGATIVVVDVVLLGGFCLVPKASLLRALCLVGAGFCIVLGCVVLFFGAKAPGHCTDHKPHAAKIVTTIFPLYDWTRNILGDRENDVELVLLQKNGGDMHSFLPSAGDIRDITTCDLFIYIGGGSDEWVSQVIAANPNDRRLELALFPIVPRTCCNHMHHQHGDAHESECQMHKAGDEHIWLSLRDAASCVEAISDKIAKICPEISQITEANARAYVANIRALDNEYVRRLAPTTILFADRFPFSRLAGDYGLNCIAAFHGCSADAEASFATVAHLAEEVDAHGLDSIFILENGERRLAEAVRSATKSKNQSIKILDSMQSINLSRDGKASYLDIMKSNLDMLAQDRD